MPVVQNQSNQRMRGAMGPAQRQKMMGNRPPNMGNAMGNAVGNMATTETVLAQPVVQTGVAHEVSPLQLAAMVGPEQAACMTAPKVSMVAQDQVWVNTIPVTYTISGVTTVMSPVVTMPQITATVQPPAQMAVNGCPAAVAAPVVAAPLPVPSCDAGGCGSCGYGPYYPGAGYVDAAAAVGLGATYPYASYAI